jgi:recombination protein RecR
MLSAAHWERETRRKSRRNRECVFVPLLAPGSNVRHLTASFSITPLRYFCCLTLITESVTKLVEQLAKLPGIGRKSAERLTYHLLRVSKPEALALADAIRDVKENVRYCKTCYNLAEAEECEICRDPRRDRTILCVVEQPRDLIALEQAGTYKGLYHVLLGRIAPLEGVGADQLTIEPLIERVRNGGFREVIMGTNPTLEGDGTALYISHQLAELPVEITRLARGITSGSVLEFANKEILADALAGRQKF